MDKEENGDIYYMLAQVYKYVRKEQEYIEALENALHNSLTLTYPKDIVKKEFDKVSANLVSYKTKEDMEEYESEEKSEFDIEDEEESEFDEEDFEIEDVFEEEENIEE